MNGANVSSTASLTSRLKVWLEGVPLFTRTILGVCVALYIGSVLIGFDTYSGVCISAAHITRDWQVWRILTSALFHMGILHVAFNMMAFVPIGQSLERLIGTVAFTHLVLLLLLLGDTLYVLLSYAAAFGPFRLGESALHSCAVGFSGIVFGLIVVDNDVSRVSQRSIFGVFVVPAKIYPWALLVFWQLLMPGASFLGHLCGVAVGQLYVWGYLKPLELKAAHITAIEAFPVLAPCFRSPAFIAYTGGSASTSGLPVSTGWTSQQPQQQQSGGSWFRPEWLRLPTSDPDAAVPSPFFGSGGGGSGGGSGNGGGSGSPAMSASAAAPSSCSSNTAGSGNFKGRGQTLGTVGAPVLSPWETQPRSAAAAAAEARFARITGSSSSSSALEQPEASSTRSHGPPPEKRKQQEQQQPQSPAASLARPPTDTRPLPDSASPRTSPISFPKT